LRKETREQLQMLSGPRVPGGDFQESGKSRTAESSR
jgi:hypothetical protein